MRLLLTFAALTIGTSTFASTREWCEVTHGQNFYSDKTVRVLNYGYADDTNAKSCGAQATQTEAAVNTEAAPIAQALETGANLELNVKFVAGSAELDKSYMQDVAQLANALKQDKNLKIKVEGHTDASGPKQLNEKLSQQRAEAIRSTLIASGATEQQVVAQGLADSRPVATNQTAEGRAENRRIEVQTIK